MASVVLAGDYGGHPSQAATPALALCIAALKAVDLLAKRKDRTG